MVTLHTEAEHILESWEQGKLIVITVTQEHILKTLAKVIRQEKDKVE